MENQVYQRYINNASQHWWWLSRIDIFESIIKKHFNSAKNLKILDYGAGSGVNINFLSKYGDVTVYEPHIQTAKYLKKNYNKIRFFKGQKDQSYDLIILADVLEHIENPLKSLSILKNIIKKGGIIIITVPAHQYLFTKKDKILNHYRRYNKAMLTQQIKDLKLNIDFISYYNFFLSFFIIPVTLLFKILNLNYINSVESKPNFIVNELFKKIFSFEKFFIKNKIILPYGVSLISIVNK